MILVNEKNIYNIKIRGKEPQGHKRTQNTTNRGGPTKQEELSYSINRLQPVSNGRPNSHLKPRKVIQQFMPEAGKLAINRRFPIED